MSVKIAPTTPIRIACIMTANISSTGVLTSLMHRLLMAKHMRASVPVKNTSAMMPLLSSLCTDRVCADRV